MQMCFFKNLSKVAPTDKNFQVEKKLILLLSTVSSKDKQHLWNCPAKEAEASVLHLQQTACWSEQTPLEQSVMSLS